MRQATDEGPSRGPNDEVVGDGPCHPVLRSAPHDNKGAALSECQNSCGCGLIDADGTQELVKSLSILDRLLALLVLLAMILGVIIGIYAPGVQEAFNGRAKLAGTSVRKSVIWLDSATG